MTLALTTLLLTVLLGGSALAQPPTGILFEGTHDAGGTVRFTVESNTSQIVALELQGVAGGGCSWGTIDLENWGGPIQIEANTFQASNDAGDTIAGEFLDHGRVEGILAIADAAKGCTTSLPWAATVKGRA